MNTPKVFYALKFSNGEYWGFGYRTHKKLGPQMGFRFVTPIAAMRQTQHITVVKPVGDHLAFPKVVKITTKPSTRRARLDAACAKIENALHELSTALMCLNVGGETAARAHLQAAMVLLGAK